MISRRNIMLAAGAVTLALTFSVRAQTARPNVVIVIVDDQGYGELSAHGNPVVRTPHLDKLHGESVRFSDFHVAPMCTPTRGQLMTGLDSLRNGAMNVSSGRTLLRRELPTMANHFSAAGYRAGIFGKWHLGDAYPYRPEDRGFHEALWFPSSHIGSVPDAWNNAYFDDTYVRNGQRKKYAGYTTDVFFSEAIAWMKTQAEQRKPFLCYLPTAAPHSPLYVPAEAREKTQHSFDAVRDKLPALPNDKAAQLVRYLAMIENVDENVGRMENFLRATGLRDNTIVIFLTDNGSTFAPEYFPAGMKGKKVTLWEGGHRVPLFIRWPGGKLRAPGDVAGLTQVQDLLPTLLELCRIKPIRAMRFDGISLAPLLRGKQTSAPADRMLVINYSRMPLGQNEYEPNNPAIPRREGAAVLWQRWRLLEDRELYDLATDPMQERNVIAAQPDVVRKMRTHLDQWWNGVKELAQEFQPSVIGHNTQNPVTLTACEWADVFVDQQSQIRRGERKNGVWHLDVAQAGSYTFTLRRWPAEAQLALSGPAPAQTVFDGKLPTGAALPIAGARLKIGAFDATRQAAETAQAVTFDVTLPAGRTTLQTWFLDAAGKPLLGAYYVEARRR